MLLVCRAGWGTWRSRARAWAGAGALRSTRCHWARAATPSRAGAPCARPGGHCASTGSAPGRLDTCEYAVIMAGVTHTQEAPMSMSDEQIRRDCEAAAPVVNESEPGPDPDEARAEAEGMVDWRP